MTNPKNSSRGSLRYIRISSQKQKPPAQRPEGSTPKYDFVLEEKISGMIPFFERKKGSEVRKLVEQGKVGELSIYSADQIGRSIEDLCDIIDFLHQHEVGLSIENIGLQTLTSGKPDRIIALMLDLRPAFAEMRRHDRKECQRLGIERAKLRGVYQLRVTTRSAESLDHFLKKPKVKEALKRMKQHPHSSNQDIARMSGLHFNTIRKVRRAAATLL